MNSHFSGTGFHKKSINFGLREWFGSVIKMQPKVKGTSRPPTRTKFNGSCGIAGNFYANA